MQLYFMRHGVAEENVSGAMPDAERALVPEGAARAKVTARALQQLGVEPARLYSSPLVRARQTAAIVGEALDVDVIIRPELDFRFNLGRLGMLIAEVSRDDALVLVGHEPSMSATISALIGGGAVEMKKGSLARVDITQVSPLSGVLAWLLPPRVLAALE